MKTITRYVIIAAVIAAVCIGGWIWWKASHSEETPDERGFEPVKVAEVKELVSLSTIEIDREVPVKGEIGTRHIVASMRVVGDISFDLEQLRVEERGDTIVVILPPERITLRESTDSGSYRIIDQWNEKFLAGSRFTTEEENAVKRDALAAAERDLRAKGYPAMARRAAAADVTALLGASTGRPVVVDTTASAGK